MKESTWRTIQSATLYFHLNPHADFISGHKSTGGGLFFITPRAMKMERRVILYTNMHVNKKRKTFAFHFKFKMSPAVWKIFRLLADN
jgi:hypothetical protein